MTTIYDPHRQPTWSRWSVDHVERPPWPGRTPGPRRRRSDKLFITKKHFNPNGMVTICLREDINRKKRFLSAIARMGGGGVYPCPDFLAPFFCQVTVLKMAIFYSNFTVIVCFLVIFVIIIIKITKILIKIILATNFFSLYLWQTAYGPACICCLGSNCFQTQLSKQIA